MAQFIESRQFKQEKWRSSERSAPHRDWRRGLRCDAVAPIYTQYGAVPETAPRPCI